MKITIFFPKKWKSLSASAWVAMHSNFIMTACEAIGQVHYHGGFKPGTRDDGILVSLRTNDLPCPNCYAIHVSSKEECGRCVITCGGCGFVVDAIGDRTHAYNIWNLANKPATPFCEPP